MNIICFNISRWCPVNVDLFLGCWNSTELRHLVDIPEEHTVRIFIVEVIIMRTQNEDLGSMYNTFETSATQRTSTGRQQPAEGIIIQIVAYIQIGNES